MSHTSGNEGIVKVNGNAYAEMRSWQYDVSAGTTDATVIGDDWEDHEVTQKSWTGSADIFWDETETAQQVDAGDVVALVFYPAGTDAGSPMRSGNATIDKITIKGTYNGLVEASISYKGKGAMTKGTV